jgi:hypothetical protein
MAACGHAHPNVTKGFCEWANCTNVAFKCTLHILSNVTEFIYQSNRSGGFPKFSVFNLHHHRAPSASSSAALSTMHGTMLSTFRIIVDYTLQTLSWAKKEATFCQCDPHFSQYDHIVFAVAWICSSQRAYLDDHVGRFFGVPEEMRSVIEPMTAVADPLLRNNRATRKAFKNRSTAPR